ncbi:MAG: pyridoxamine 5'-phosphate oxidase [Rhodomicrobium sp.]|jgi:pyridoxamine 5'-phosphate oxidase
MPSKADTEDFTEASSPEALFSQWFDDAERTEINDANAMTLATVDKSGMPNARVVLLKGLDARGFVFYTNFESAKGLELLATPKASLCFHWKSLRRQVRVRGTAEPVSTAEADAYYASRPIGSRIGAWASQQSRPLGSRQELIDAVARFEKEFQGMNPVRPRYWSGFRVIPLEIEFWADRPHRLHDRVSFTRENPDMRWTKTRLYP